MLQRKFCSFGFVHLLLWSANQPKHIVSYLAHLLLSIGIEMLNRPGLFIARLQACDLGIIDEHLCFTLWYGNCKLIETPSGNCTQFPRQQFVARVSGRDCWHCSRWQGGVLVC